MGAGTKLGILKGGGQNQAFKKSSGTKNISKYKNSKRNGDEIEFFKNDKDNIRNIRTKLVISKSDK